MRLEDHPVQPAQAGTGTVGCPRPSPAGFGCLQRVHNLSNRPAPTFDNITVKEKKFPSVSVERLVLLDNSMTPSHCRYKIYITMLRAPRIFPFFFFFFSDRQVSLQNPGEKRFYNSSNTVWLTWWSSQGTLVL